MADDARICLSLHVDPQLDGQRADQFLATKIRRLSRSRASAIVKNGDLRRDGRALRPASRVRGDEILSLWRTPPEEPAAPESFEVLHDDDHLLVIDKPAGLAVHPSARYFRTTLTQLLRRQAGSADAVVPRICHRLDRETSGVLLLARTLDVERRLKRAFAHGQVHKTYWALVEGSVSATPQRIDIPLGPLGGAIRIRMGAVPDAPPARTEVRLLAALGDRSLVACYPRTGRTHQIRAHLSLIGHPIVGDKIYGGQGEDWFLRWAEGGEAAASVDELGWPRQCLHARALELDPDLGVAPQFFVAPWPTDLPEIPQESIFLEGGEAERSRLSSSPSAPRSH
ncbi:MAG: RluA family pseudouridine synthase [Pseudomonadota bacterium]